LFPKSGSGRSATKRRSDLSKHALCKILNAALPF
jgi:hypothetical protein